MINKLSGYIKQSATDALKTTSKEVTQKTGEETGDLIGNKFDNRILKVSGSLPQNNQKQQQMNMIKKYLKKNIYLQKKNWKLLMIYD